MTRMLPALYQWGMRYRILSFYAALKSLETQLERDGASEGALRARLDELERRVNHLRIPRTFSPLLYNFRIHLEFVRACLRPSPVERAPPS